MAPLAARRDGFPVERVGCHFSDLGRGEYWPASAAAADSGAAESAQWEDVQWGLHEGWEYARRAAADAAAAAATAGHVCGNAVDVDHETATIRSADVDGADAVEASELMLVTT